MLVIDHTGEGYRFRHALTRDAIYEDALPRERVRIHRAYAEALSADPALAGTDASVAAALALHWSAAHDVPRALDASIEAAPARGGVRAGGGAAAFRARARAVAEAGCLRAVRDGHRRGAAPGRDERIRRG